MQAMGSCLTNKYAEGYPGKRYYGGCEVVDQSEQLAIDRIKQIFGAEWANVQPHSGAQANAAVFLAVLNPGDKFMGLNLAHGGHLSHGSAVNTSGILYTPCEYKTSTTHKTLRGPRGGIILMGKDFPNPWGKKTPKGEIKMMSQLLDSAVFPGIQGGPLEHVIAAKAVAFYECMQPEYKEYQIQVQKNARVLAQALMDRWFHHRIGRNR